MFLCDVKDIEVELANNEVTYTDAKPDTNIYKRRRSLILS
jgi:hypothetical protein